MGVTDMFDAGLANFSDFTSTGVFIDAAIHQVREIHLHK